MNPVLDFINELQSEAICFKFDALIDELELMKQQEVKDQQYFESLFNSIMFEQPKLTA